MSKISIVVGAYKIDDGPVNNFVSWNESVFQTADVELIIVSDREIKIDKEWCKVLVYPVEQEVFSIGKTVNYGIRRAESDIIIKSDIDIFFTSEVLAHVQSSVSEGHGMVCICGNVNRLSYAKTWTEESWERIKKLVSGRGACFAMSKKDWYEVCGYNERIVGWGADDDDMWNRANGAIDMKLDCSRPIFHVSHPIRKRKDGNSFFPVRTGINRKIGWSDPWKDESWGNPEENRLT